MIFSFNDSIETGNKLVFLSNGEIVRFEDFDKTKTYLKDSFVRYNEEFYKAKIDVTVGDFDISKWSKVTTSFMERGRIKVGTSQDIFFIDNREGTLKRNVSGFSEYDLQSTEISTIEFIRVVGGASGVSIFGEN